VDRSNPPDSNHVPTGTDIEIVPAVQENKKLESLTGYVKVR
jgi:hypothetical protein